MYKLILRMMGLIALTIAPMTGYAITVVQKVYRADERPLEQIISQYHGFYPRAAEGSQYYDSDLSHHFEGESVDNGVSPFVSTTSSLRSAVEHAASLGSPNSEEPFDPTYVTYIYDIIPADNFYDVQGSLTHAMLHSEPHSERSNRLDRLFMRMAGCMNMPHYLDFPIPGASVSRALPGTC